MHLARLFNLTILTLLLTLPPVTHGIECATSKCYIDAYKSVDPTELPVIERVQEIYRNLSKTIGSQKANRSKLLVIDSDGYPWAVALSDNSVVLTKGAIDLMYQEQDMALGDARVAFVLGHELSHLDTEDLFHHRAFLANTNPTNKRFDPLIPRPEEENRADLRGYTFATIAGYDTGRLIGDEGDFFTQWLAQINDVQGGTHPNLAARSEYVQQGFKNILQDVPYYQFATVLAHFGNYKDAQHLYEDFLNKVETKEAYSNLGYVHLQQARDKMPSDMAYRYWIPTLLEPKSGLEMEANRSLFKKEVPPQAMNHLYAAEQKLKLSIDMNQDELTSYINLAAVYMYMPDKTHRAYAAIEDARNTSIGKRPAVRAQLESIYQLIRVADDGDAGDRWPKARDALANLTRSTNAPENTVYNYARMLDDRGRDNTALKYWNRLYGKLHELPAVYQAQVCFRLQVDQCSVSAEKQKTPWTPHQLPLGRDIRYPDVQSYLKTHWNKDKLPTKDLPDIKAQVFTNSNGDSLLALDNHIEMMIRRDIPPQLQTLSGLQEAFGSYQVLLPVAGGMLASYGNGWAALLQNNVVTEIWIAQLN